jgi:hypothetical protein
MEVRHAVLSGRHRRRSYFYLRTTQVPREGTPGNIYDNFVDTGEGLRLGALKTAIRETSGRPVATNPLDAEAAEMAAFAAGRLRWFQGRASELQQLRAFVDQPRSENEGRVCVVRAVAGAGKSALVAKLAEQLSGSPHLVITHFVGATERSADLRSLLERLVNEVDRHGIPHPDEVDAKQDLESLKARFSSRVETYAGDRRIVLLIDAVNQLTDGHDLSWLPRRQRQDSAELPRRSGCARR